MTASDFITELKEKPYIRIERKYEVSTERGQYYITEKFRYASSRETFEGGIACHIPETKTRSEFGDADIDIVFDSSKDKPRATIKDVQVNSRVNNKGIGTQCMLAAISFIKAAKEYYDIKEKVRFAGWLSAVDKDLGNWDRSVPFYYKVGEKAGVEHFFEVNGSSEKYYTPEEFLSNVGNNHGSIVYML